MLCRYVMVAKLFSRLFSKSETLLLQTVMRKSSDSSPKLCQRLSGIVKFCRGFSKWALPYNHLLRIEPSLSGFRSILVQWNGYTFSVCLSSWFQLTRKILSIISYAPSLHACAFKKFLENSFMTE